ncbi:MAG: phage tail tape measure protein [Rhodospirillum sp.]|nr:phage tail tape measure protein [Rhodospirillum sp.]MCF8500178.1 phage tail tape measure protein [Rhodospirillum sp.]
MADLRHQLIIDLGGNLRTSAAAAARGVAAIGQQATRSMGVANRAAAGFDRGLTVLGNRYTAFLTAAGLGAAMKGVGDLEQRLAYVGRQAGRSKEEMNALRDEIFRVANMPQVRLDPSQIADALESFLDKTGELDAFRENLLGIGASIRASGAEARQVGLTFAGMFSNFGIKDAAEVQRALTAALKIGDKGSFTGADFARHGMSLTATYAANTKRGGVAAARELMTAMQVINAGIGDADQSKTALEGLFRSLNDPKVRRFIENFGIQIMDPEEPSRMRDALDIMMDIVKMTGGDQQKLALGITDSSARDALKGLSTMYGQGTMDAQVASLRSATDDANVLMTEATDVASNFNGALQMLTNTAQQFANTKLVGPVEDLAMAINSLDPEALQEYLDIAGKIALVGGGLVAANMLARNVTGKGLGQLAVGGVGRLLGKGKGAMGAAAGLAAAGVTPVQVTNWPAGFGPGGIGGGATGPGKGKAGGIGRFNRGSLATGAAIAERGQWWSGLLGGAKGLGRRLPVLGTVLAAGQMADAAMSGDGKTMAQTAGGLGGGMVLGAGGAALGTMILPGIGTVVGGGLGYMAGEIGGSELGGELYDVISEWFSDNKPEPVEGQISIAVDVSPDLKATVRGVKRVRGPVDLAVEARTGATMGGN